MSKPRRYRRLPALDPELGGATVEVYVVSCLALLTLALYALA